MSASLDVAEGVARQGATVTDLEEVVRSVIATEPRATLKGLDIVWADTFEPAEGPVTRTVGIMISADFGEVLLIDQREITP